MKLKKLLIMLATVMTLSACSTAQNSSETQNSVSADTQGENGASQAAEDVSAQEAAPVIDVAANKPCNEIQEADIFSNKIQLAGKLLTFPMTVEEFTQAMGFEIDDPEETVSPWTFDGQMDLDTDKYEYSFYVTIGYENAQNEELSVKDCTIDKIEIELVEDEEVLFIPGGFGVKNADKAQLKEKFGDWQDEQTNTVIYVQDPVYEKNNEYYSATGREVQLELWEDNGSLEKYIATFADDDTEKIYHYKVPHEDMAFDIPKKFFLKRFQAISGDRELAAQYKNGNISGELSIDTGDYITEYESYDKFKGEFENYGKEYTIVKDDDNLFIAYASINDDDWGYALCDEITIYNKNINAVIYTGISFYTQDTMSESDINDVRNYAIDILSTFNVE